MLTVNSSVFDGGSACWCPDLRALAFGGNGLELAFIVFAKDFAFVVVNFRHLFHLDSDSLSLFCDSRLQS